MLALHTQYQGVLKEAIIRDPTTSVKLLLWENSVEMLEQNKKYTLQNITMKRSKNNIYLNTTKADIFTFSKTSAFTTPVFTVEDDVRTTSAITARILGIQHTFQALASILCNKKVIAMPDDPILSKREACKLMQAITSSEANWYIRILVQTHLPLMKNSD